MRPTLLLTVFFPPLLGGVEHYWHEVARRWPSGQLVVYTNPATSTWDFDRVATYPIIRQSIFAWPKFKPSWLPMLWRVLKVIRRRNIRTLMFGHYANYVLIGLIFKWLFGKPYRIMTHGVDTVIPTHSLLNSWILRLTLKNAERIYCNSKTTRHYLLGLGINDQRILIAAPGIDADLVPKFNKDEAKRRLGLQGCYVILTVARLINLKGIDLVIRAIAQLDDHDDLVYVIVGDGPERSALTKIVTNLKLINHVKFIGQINDDPETKSIYFSAADLFVLTTRPVNYHVESFGIVFLEAGAYRLPVIASRSGGTGEIIRHNDTGILIKPDSISELVAAITKLRNDGALSQIIGQRLYEHVKTQYRWNKTVEMLTDGT